MAVHEYEGWLISITAIVVIIYDKGVNTSGDATAAQTLVKDAIAIATTDPAAKKSDGQQQPASLSLLVPDPCEEHLFSTLSLLLTQEREGRRELTRARCADADNDELISVYSLVAKIFTAQMSAFTNKPLLFHWLGMLQEAMGAIAEATSFYSRGTLESATHLIGMTERYIESLEAEEVPYAMVRSILQVAIVVSSETESIYQRCFMFYLPLLRKRKKA